MGKVRTLRRAVRAAMSQWGFPLPPFVIAELAQAYGESPNVVSIIAHVDWEDPKKVLWQPWEIAYLKSHLHCTDRHIAEVLHRSVESVRGKRVGLNMTKRQRRAACEA